MFEKLKVTVNRKGRVNGAEYDGTRIIVQTGKRLVYTEDVKKASKVNEFKRLVERAELEHGKTGAAVVEEAVPDVTVSEDPANSVLRNSIERLESEIDEMVADIESRSVEASVTLDKEKIREFRGITKTADHNLDNGGLKVQEEYFRDLAKDEPNELRSKLYEGRRLWVKGGRNTVAEKPTSGERTGAEHSGRRGAKQRPDQIREV